LTAPTVKLLSSSLGEYNLKMDNNISTARQERWNKEMGGNIKEAIKTQNSSCSDYPETQVL